MKAKLGVLMIGNFQSAHIHTHAVCEDLAPRLRELGWRVFTASGRAGRLARVADMVSAALRHRNGYQVAMVDVHAGAAFRWAELLAGLLRKLRKPTVLTLRTGSLPQVAKAHPERIRQLLGGATAVVTPSPFLQQAMSSYRADILHVPHGIDLSVYPFRQRTRLEPRLIWLRAFYDAYYNPTLAVRVVAELLPEFPELQLTMIGPDRGDGSLQATQALVRKLELESQIQIRGGVAKQEVPMWLDRADVFLNSPRVDNTPMTVLEAMACGLCVVSTSVGGMPFMLRDGVDSLLSPDDDAGKMADSIKEVLKNLEKAATISKLARMQAIRHDWPNVLPLWIGILTALTIGEAPPSPTSVSPLNHQVPRRASLIDQEK